MSASTRRQLGLTLMLALAACSSPDESDLFDNDGDSGTGGSSGTSTSAEPDASTSTTAGTGGSSSGGSSSGETSSGGGSTSSGGSPNDSSGGASASGGGPATGGSSGNGGSSGPTGSGGDGGAAGDSSSGGGASSGGASSGGASSGGASSGGASSGGASSGGASSGGASSGGSSGTGGSGGSNHCTATDEVCDGVDNNCNDMVDEDDVCPLRCVGARFGGHRYLFCDEPGPQNQADRDWDWAQQFCGNQGQRLVAVGSEEENDFIYQKLNALGASGQAWMGATDQGSEDIWEWATGSNSNDWVPFYDADDDELLNDGFEDWASGEPDNVPGSGPGADCGVFEYQEDMQWAWADRSCNADYTRLVCEGSD